MNGMNDLVVALVILFLGTTFSTIGFLGIRVLRTIDLNQTALAASIKELWERHDQLSKDVYLLQGEHHADHERREKHRNP